MSNKIVSLNSVAYALAAASFLSLPALSMAESVQVPVGKQAQQKSTLQRPFNGMKQSQVQTSFGKPLDWRDAVGTPPISSWIYADFVVYFEYDEVIHSVLKPAPQPVASSGS